MAELEKWCDTSTEGFPVPSITNVTVTVNLCCKLHPKWINSQVNNSEYNPNRFLGSTNTVIVRIRSPRATAQIYRSGRMVCLGTQSVQMARKAARRFARIIQKLGYPVQFRNFVVTNVVGQCDVRSTVALDKLMVNLSKNTAVKASFNCELFPCLTYKLSRTDDNVSLNVFNTGKISITGAKSFEQMVAFFNDFYRILLDFKHEMLREKINHLVTHRSIPVKNEGNEYT